jgi:hypothetical protein
MKTDYQTIVVYSYEVQVQVQYDEYVVCLSIVVCYIPRLAILSKQG